MSIESIKHKKDTRAHIPSREEAGYEQENAAVAEGRQTLELPKNPVTHRGQDPELFWMNKYGNDDRDDLLHVDIRSLVLGFNFESDIETGNKTTSMGTFEVTRARIHDDLLQDGLKKKPGQRAAAFVTIGEPDITLHKDGDVVTVEINGLDIYDPVRDEVKARNLNEIVYWMVDDDYDGSNFVVKQVFFCGGDKDEFDKWKKGISDVARAETKKKAEKTLKIEIEDDAFDRLYGFKSHPVKLTRKNQQIAVRLISQFGEESTKVLIA